MRLVTWVPRETDTGRRVVSRLDGGPADHAPHLGVLLNADPVGRGGRVIDLADVPGLGAIATVRRAIEDGDLARLLAVDPGLQATRAAWKGAAGVDLRSVPRTEVRLLAPVLRPGKIICIGLNHADHCREQGRDIPERPMLFAKFANSLVADGDPVIHHDVTHALDLEAELAVVIGSRARRVPAADGMRVVAGYTAANDISARDLQGVKPALGPGERGDGQWLRAKGSDTFLPLGPALVTADEVDGSRAGVRSWIIPGSARPEADPACEIGVPYAMQAGSAADLIFGIPTLIEFASAVITLEPGDLIVTGTPAGVGAFRVPPFFLRPGDVAGVEVDGIGRIENPIVDADGMAPAGSPAARLLSDRA